MNWQIKKYLKFSCFLSLGILTAIAIFGLDSSVVAQVENKVDSGVQVSLFQAIILGFVQGATEFIPISSTAHLKAIPVFFGWGGSWSIFYGSYSAWKRCCRAVLFLVGYQPNYPRDDQSYSSSRL